MQKSGFIPDVGQIFRGKSRLFLYYIAASDPIERLVVPFRNTQKLRQLASQKLSRSSVYLEGFAKTSTLKVSEIQSSPNGKSIVCLSAPMIANVGGRRGGVVIIGPIKQQRSGWGLTIVPYVTLKCASNIMKMLSSSLTTAQAKFRDGLWKMGSCISVI